jgi:NAD(P)-dependent dehydrogenase (short-subunit alcohol dehydrogenase family)
VSKAALIKLSENLDAERRGTGVSVTAFDPGLLNEGMTQAHMERGHVGDQHSDAILDWALRAGEMGRFTPVPEAVSALVRLVTETPKPASAGSD